MLQKKLQTIIVLCSFFAVIGCQSEPRPEGLPELVPLQLFLTQEGKPLSEASVQLFSSDVPWSITGNTDANGMTKIVTYGKFPGAPLGIFKVVVSKTETEEKITKNLSTVKIFSLINPALRKHETTTLEITVEKGTKRVTLDVGKPVRVLIDTIAPGGI